MTLNDVITRLDAIATERYPMITDLDAEALRIAIKYIEQKPKIGHWIDCCERDPYYRCSECSERIFGSFRKFCPNCGAKMDKEQAEC